MRVPYACLLVGSLTGAAAACGSGSPPSALQPEASACGAHATTGDLPADVASVLQAKCQTCHRAPPINHAPFPLLTYEDVLAADTIAPYAGQPIWEVMAIVIQPGGVPHMPFGSAPQLTSTELGLLANWLSSCAVPVAEGTGGDTGEDAGAPSGDAQSD